MTTIDDSLLGSDETCLFLTFCFPLVLSIESPQGCLGVLFVTAYPFFFFPYAPIPRHDSARRLKQEDKRKDRKEVGNSIVGRGRHSELARNYSTGYYF